MGLGVQPAVRDTHSPYLTRNSVVAVDYPFEFDELAPDSELEFEFGEVTPGSATVAYRVQLDNGGYVLVHRDEHQHG